MKQSSIIILLCIGLVGCSVKNSARKNGAILGTTAGALAGGVMGIVVAGQKSGSSDRFTTGAVIGAVIVGSLGYLTGSTMGYIVDEVKGDKEEIVELSTTQAIVNKQMNKSKGVLSTPSLINEAILNGTVLNHVNADSKMEPIMRDTTIEDNVLEEGGLY